MGRGYIQIRNTNTTEERESIERCGQEMKEENDNLWSVTPEERYRQILNKEEREKQTSDECEMLRQRKGKQLKRVFMLLALKKTSSGELLQLRKSILSDNVACGEFKKQKAQELKQNWYENKMHGYFVGEMPKKLMSIKLGNSYPKVI